MFSPVAKRNKVPSEERRMSDGSMAKPWDDWFVVGMEPLMCSGFIHCAEVDKTCRSVAKRYKEKLCMMLMLRYRHLCCFINTRFKLRSRDGGRSRRRSEDTVNWSCLRLQILSRHKAGSESPELLVSAILG